MSLISLRDVELGFGEKPLLDGVTLQIDAGERVCLVGRNGSGKTSLLSIITGDIEADSGQVVREPDVRVADLPQSIPQSLAGGVRAVVAQGLGELGSVIERYHRLLASAEGEASLRAIEVCQRRIEAQGGWDVDARVESTLTRLALDGEADFQSLSGGLQRRTLLACALVAQPQLLILDEPTNHLDVGTIEWLEDLVRGWSGAVLFTTHDRRFLEAVTTRILELDRGRLTSWPGDYANYLRRREERAAAEAGENARFDRKLSEEETWIRQGIKARRTRNEGRVRRLLDMRKTRAQRRRDSGRARFAAQSAEPSGKQVIEARGVCFGYGAGVVIRDFDTLIDRGDRVGVIGPNGSGKTTLLRLLLGELTPDAGEVILGTRIELGYFDQHRARLDEATSVADSVADGAEHVEVGGAKRHIISYLQDFLFTPARARSPVSTLSGGERGRLLLARLFARPSNLLVLDEPTNDFDIETLELLEERLIEYPGTVLLVSHDRAFLDNVVTSTLVLEDRGRVGEYVGGYADWLRQRASSTPHAKPKAETKGAPKARSPQSNSAPRRLGFNEQRELKSLPDRIERLEAELATLQTKLASPEFYKAHGDTIAATRDTLESVEAQLQSCYERWSELEAVGGG